MLIRKLENNHLVNIEDAFDDYYFPDLDDAYTEYCKTEAEEYDNAAQLQDSMRKREFIPFIHVDKLSQHYFGIPDDAVFDSIEDDVLEVFLHQRTTALRNCRIQEEVAFIKSVASKVKICSKKKAKYIVEFEIPSYEEVVHLRAEGYKVIHSISLIKHLSDGCALIYNTVT